MGALAEIVVKRHKPLVAASAALLAMSVWASMSIKVNTKLQDMLPAGNPKVESLVRINDQFQGGSGLTMIVQGPDKAGMIAGAEDLAARIGRSGTAGKLVRYVQLKNDRDFLGEWALMLQDPDDIENSGRMFADANVLNYIASLNETFEDMYTGDGDTETIETSKQENDAVGGLTRIESFAESLLSAIEAPSGVDEGIGASLAEQAALGDEYFFSPDGSTLIFTVATNFPVDDMVSSKELMSEIKKIRAEAAAAHPSLTFGYTGEVAINADDSAAIESDTLYPMLVAYLAILVLFLFCFRQIRVVFFALVALVVGIVLNYGVLGASIGEINMLTSVIGVVLVGMGIDYGVQFISAYSMFRSEGLGAADAVRMTFKRAGTGIFLSAATTVVSSYAFLLSSSKAIRQLGFLAGTGILTCLAAMLVLLPSLLVWFGGRNKPSFFPQIDFSFLARIGKASSRGRKFVFAAAGTVAAAAVVAGLSLVGLEYDYMKMKPQTVPSMLGYKTVMEKFEITPMGAMIALDSIGEARDLAEALEDKRGVADIDTVANFIASDEDQDERLAAVADLRARGISAAPLVYGPDDAERLRAEILRLEQNIVEIGDLSVAGLGEDNRIVRKRNAMIRTMEGREVVAEGKEVFSRLSAAVAAEGGLARLSAIDASFAPRLASIGSRMASVDGRLGVADLPVSIKDRYFDSSGKANLLTVVPTKSAVRDSEAVVRFAEMLDSVEPGLTGTTPLSVSWMAELRDEAMKLSVVILFVIAVILMATFRSAKMALRAASPMLVAMVLLYGLVGLFGVQLNAISMCLIPMLLGACTSYGVFMTSRFVIEGGDLDRTLEHTVKGIFLSAVTTLVGFGSLWWVASFAALATIGGIFFLGIAAAFVSTVFFLPAVLGGRAKKESVLAIEAQEKSA